MTLDNGTDGQTDRQTDGQTDGHTDRQSATQYAAPSYGGGPHNNIQYMYSGLKKKQAIGTRDPDHAPVSKIVRSLSIFRTGTARNLFIFLHRWRSILANR